MAVCKRCGATFDYKKRDGVCPKCCFYNRPANAWQEDESWVKNYNYEDNSYNVVAHELDGSEEDDRLGNVLKKNKDSHDQGFFRIMGHGQNKEVDGSHIHLADGKVVKNLDRQGKDKDPDVPPWSKPVGFPKILAIILWVICIIVCIYLINIVYFLI